MHLRYTDLTHGASGSTAEAWIDASQYGTAGTWEYVPCVMTRRIADASTLLSAFVAVLEPYEKESNIVSIKRLDLPDPSAAIDIMRKDGWRDVCVITAPEHNSEAILKEIPIQVNGAMALVTFNGKKPERLVLCQGTLLQADDVILRMKEKTEFLEIVLENEKAQVVGGDGRRISSIRAGGRDLQLTR